MSSVVFLPQNATLTAEIDAPGASALRVRLHAATSTPAIRIEDRARQVWSGFATWLAVALALGCAVMFALPNVGLAFLLGMGAVCALLMTSSHAYEHWQLVHGRDGSGALLEFARRPAEWWPLSEPVIRRQIPAPKSALPPMLAPVARAPTLAAGRMPPALEDRSHA